MGCIFCDVIAGKTPAFFVYEDDDYVAIMDKYPIHRGHTLLIPRIHHEKILDMPTNLVGALFSKVPLIAKAVVEATQADGFNVGQNNGRAANQIVPHVHVHVIPRYKNITTAWPKRTLADDNELKSLAEKIRKCINLTVK